MVVGVPAGSAARELEELPVEQPSAVKGADDALLEMCKEMSATLRRLENHLTSRVQAEGMRATSTTNIAEEVTEEQEVGSAHEPPYWHPIDKVNRVIESYSTSSQRSSGRHGCLFSSYTS